MDHTAYPHILDAIIAAASYDSLIALRGTSSAMRERVDPLLAERLQVRLPLSTIRETEGPLDITYGPSIPLTRYPGLSNPVSNHLPSPSAQPAPVSSHALSRDAPRTHIHSTALKAYASTLANVRIVDIHAPATHYRVFQLYPLLSGVHTVRYLGPDLYRHAYAEATVSVRHIVDQFLISLDGASRMICSLDADSAPQIRQIALPVLRRARKAVVNVWWSPARPERAVAHRTNLVADPGITDLVFICRPKNHVAHQNDGAQDEAQGGEKAKGKGKEVELGRGDLEAAGETASNGWKPKVPRSAAEANRAIDADADARRSLQSLRLPLGIGFLPPALPGPPSSQRMGMFRNILKYGMSRILSPDWTKIVTFVGLADVHPAALGYDPDTDLDTPRSLEDDVLNYILDYGIGGQPPDDRSAAMSLLRERVRFLSHEAYAKAVGETEYEVEMLPEPAE